jgi:hypothetical protein
VTLRQRAVDDYKAKLDKEQAVGRNMITQAMWDRFGWDKFNIRWGDDSAQYADIDIPGEDFGMVAIHAAGGWTLYFANRCTKCGRFDNTGLRLDDIHDLGKALCIHSTRELCMVCEFKERV